MFLKPELTALIQFLKTLNPNFLEVTDFVLHVVYNRKSTGKAPGDIVSFSFEEYLTLSTYNLQFDFLGITKFRFRINKLPLTQVQLPDYNFKSTPTESSKRGTAICIKKTLNYKLRKKLIIYKPNQLESTFIEVMQNKETLIVGCIYIHPSTEISDFNKYYLSNLIEMLFKKLIN